MTFKVKKYPETVESMLPCSGTCSEYDIRVTTHYFERCALMNGHTHVDNAVTPIKPKQKPLEGKTYALIFACAVCGAERMWGNVVARDDELLFGRQGGRARN